MPPTSDCETRHYGTYTAPAKETRSARAVRLMQASSDLLPENGLA
jgi:hypothetical protein